MILHYLHELYQRRMADPDPTQRLPIYGFEDKPIPYILVIDPEGKLKRLRSTLSSDKKPIPLSFSVPQTVKRASNIAANLLWDTVEYCLGVDTRGKPERVIEQHAAFRARINALPENVRQDEGILAINRFLDQFTPEQLHAEQDWPILLETNPNISFQLQGDDGLICQRPAVRAACTPEAAATDEQGVCLITGQYGPIERLHTAIKGVRDAQAVGANIVSFNAEAYCSFGREQGANAPISKQAAFAYTTSLNALLAKDSGQSVQVGDASTVFWGAKKDPLEQDFADAFNGPKKDKPFSGSDAVKRLYAWVYTGKAQTLEGDNRFHVLGLAPNAARISIRFWETLPLRDLAMRTVMHFDDLNIVRAPFDPEYPSMFRLLAACAAQGKADNIPPALAGDVMRAVLQGTPYPKTFFAAALGRCRAEQDINYYRAAILKACIIRNKWPSLSSRSPLTKDFLVMSDQDNQTEHPEVYWMGQLFAILEKLQKEAIDPNSSIRDRFFGAAMSSPSMVFNTLLRLHHHHLSKLGKSAKTEATSKWLEKLITDTIKKINSFPDQLSPEEQGLFAIGYYHKRHEFFNKKSSPSAE